MGLSLSSIGLGTYLGDDGAAADAGYEACVAAALGAGINVFDSAINYRGQKSERAVGRALASGVRVRRARGATRSSSRPRAATSRTTRTTRDPRGATSRRRSSIPASRPKTRSRRAATASRPRYLRDQIARSRREPRSRDHRSLLPPQRRDAARGRGSPDVPRSPAAGDRDAGAGGRRRPDRRVGPRDVGRPARSAGASGAPLARRGARDRRRRSAAAGHHFRAVQLPVQSRDGAGHGLPLAGARTGPRSRPCRPPGPWDWRHSARLRSSRAGWPRSSCPRRSWRPFPALQTSASAGAPVRPFGAGSDDRAGGGVEP